MQSGLSHAAFHPVAKHRHQHLAVLFLSAKPALGDIHQLLLFRVQKYGIYYSMAHHHRCKRPTDIVGGTETKCTVYVCIARLRRDHDGRNIIEPMTTAHLLKHLKAAHTRHHDIKQQCGYLSAIGLQSGKGLLSARYLDDIIVLLKHICKYSTIQLGIVCNKQLSFIHSTLSETIYKS